MTVAQDYSSRHVEGYVLANDDHSNRCRAARNAGLRHLDLTAVRNAITETWSNAQTEGQINRLKMLKQARYGRAGVDLLLPRMIPLSPSHTN
jgi:transposase